MKRVLTALAAPVAALVVAVIISSLALLASDHSPVETFRAMWEFGTRERSLIGTVNRSVPLYLSAVAVAIGFKMGLFNIGVEGQYRLAALLAAAAGAAVTLPPFLHVPFILLVGMVVGGAWAGVAGVLKATRGVHEVIATIMLNTVATGLSAYLLFNYFEDDRVETLNLTTEEIRDSGWIPSLNGLLEWVTGDTPEGTLQGFLVGAIVVGILYWLLVNRTRFGFELRASGLNPFAARAAGVDDKAMIVKTMVLSGAIAGLVAMGPLLGFFHRYTLDFPVGLGFTGIGIALLGRNHPVGMAAGALLFGFLETSAQILDLEDIPKEIVDIMQGVILLSVVVAWEVVRRLVAAAETRAAAEHDRPTGAPTEVSA